MLIAKRLVALAILVGVPGIVPVAAQTDDPDTGVIRAAVEATEWKRQAAMVKADIATLEKIYAESLTYTHSLAITQTRKQVLDMLSGGNVSYDKFTTQSANWSVYPGTVVGTGTQTIELTVDGNAVTANNRYTVVYVQLDGRWKCVAYQSTPLPDIRERQMQR